MGQNRTNVSIHKGNDGALVLSETLLPQFTLRRKHYETKKWFHEDIVKLSIKLFKIDRVKTNWGYIFKGITMHDPWLFKKEVYGLVIIYGQFLKVCPQEGVLSVRLYWLRSSQKVY